MNTSETITSRERFREQVRGEIKQAALGQLADGGPQAISVNAIGKELGVSGPAIHRYFKTRDDLVNELVVDAYHDLAVALERATHSARNPDALLRLVARTYRDWALAEPHRYRLLYGPPLPGHDAHSERLIDAAQQAMNVLVAALPGDVVDPEPGRGLEKSLRAWAKDRGIELEPGRALQAIRLWYRLHGLVSLEIGGNFESMGLDGSQLLNAEIAEV